VAPSIQLVAWGRGGAWKNHLPQPGEGACSQDHVTWRPRLHPGRKRGLGVSRASHTFHNKPTHGKNPATRPSNHSTQTGTDQQHGNAEGTGQREGAAAPSRRCVHRLRPCAHSWRAGVASEPRLPPGSTCLRPPPARGEGAPTAAQPAGWEAPRSRGRGGSGKAREAPPPGSAVTPPHVHDTDMEQNPIHAIKKGGNRRRRRRRP